MPQSYPQTWELDSLYPHPSTPEFRSQLDALKSDLAAVADRSDRLPQVTVESATVSTWAAFSAAFEKVNAEVTALRAFIECHAAADAANKLFQQIDAELAALTPLRSRIATNIEFALQSASEETVSAFLAANPELARSAYFFQVARRNAALRLPREQELLAADLDVDGLHAWGRLYDRLSGDLRVQVMEKGELVSKSPGQVQFDSAQRAVRENNFYAADKAWRTLEDTCADAINHIAGSRLVKYQRLGVDHLAAPLNLNRLQADTLQTMWRVVSERKSCLVQFLERKAKLLGLSKLSWYDLQAPLPTSGVSSESELDYNTACDLVINSFNDFSRDLGDFARMAIEQRWIEVENRPGKRQGGFCTDIPTRLQSRIFMTFTNSADSMSTLAHELGHAYHTWVLREEPPLLRDYPMNLAETASTFAEAVLGETQLAKASTRDAKLQLLDGMLSDAVAFLMNIHARFLFEDAFHRERRAGEVPAARLNELMLAAQNEAYCDSLDSNGWNPRFWVSKLHFYITGWPFYNFPYTFGYLLSLGTYALAQGSPDFAERFRRFLIATGCQDSEDAVASALGYDLRQPDFWERSINVIESRVAQFLDLTQ